LHAQLQQQTTEDREASKEKSRQQQRKDPSDNREVSENKYFSTQIEGKNSSNEGLKWTSNTELGKIFYQTPRTAI
jgi:hypothetical protein